MLYWLVSYPRSGNTWCRAFLTNLMRPAGAPAGDINALAAAPIPINRDGFDTCLDLSSSDLTNDEIDRLCRLYYLQLARDNPARSIMKLHNAYRLASDGRPLYPAEATAGIVLIVRNPLDVAVSLAPFLSFGMDRTIDWMASDRAELSAQGESGGPSLPQRLGSWSSHTRSWLDSGIGPVHLVRYEDLQAAPTETFAALADFLGISMTSASLADAIQVSRFDALREQEQANPNFTLRPRGGTAFFRRGRSDVWREALTAAQRKSIQRSHAPTMHRLGYSTDQDFTGAR